MSGIRLLHADRAVFVSGGNPDEVKRTSLSLVSDGEVLIVEAKSAMLPSLYQMCRHLQGGFVLLQDAERYVLPSGPNAISPLQELVEDFPRLTFIFAMHAPMFPRLRVVFGFITEDAVP